MIHICLLLVAKCPQKLEILWKSFGIKMLMETYLCFHCLENVSSQLLYRALSPIASMVRKCFVLHYHLVTYGMDVSETLITG